MCILRGGFEKRSYRFFASSSCYRWWVSLTRLFPPHCASHVAQILRLYSKSLANYVGSLPTGLSVSDEWLCAIRMNPIKEVYGGESQIWPRNLALLADLWLKIPRFPRNSEEVAKCHGFDPPERHFLKKTLVRTMWADYCSKFTPTNTNTNLSWNCSFTIR